jgi:branched-chain amino acid transport system permease protein
MVSLAQMTIAALGGYMVAILGTSSIDTISLGWPLWLAVIVAIIIATMFGTATGALAVRTRGIYTIMITLAVAAGFFYFTRQNYTIFNGYSGFPGIRTPDAFGIAWRQPMPFYYLTLSCAVLAYLAVLYVSRSPFGLALQGIRDNPRRMSALGYNVVAHRIAAYAFASVIAAVAGILLVWQNAQISPGTAGIGPVIDILVIAIVGGLAHPIGAVHRRHHLRRAANLFAGDPGSRRVSRRALQDPDRPWIPCHRLLVSRRRARPVGALQAAPRQRLAAVARSGESERR